MSMAVRADDKGLKFGIVGVNDMTPATAEAPLAASSRAVSAARDPVEGLHEYMDTKFVSLGI